MEMLQVTSQELRDSAGRLASGAQEVEQILATLRNLISPMEQSWRGGASVAFQTMWQQWDTNAAGLREALDGIGRLLATAGQTYADAESSVKASMAG